MRRIDHIVIAVRELDRPAELYRRLGFQALWPVNSIPATTGICLAKDAYPQANRQEKLSEDPIIFRLTVSSSWAGTRGYGGKWMSSV
jgi:hypothetical protein